ncbi:MAG: SDR family NAD(P)-dependent oxidoreductase [Phenylobacterium sp.]|uniref:SDR family NAD(P)-dependent oxidoreductase n=1 Tax=Phenylobacterium sp. TaxID=1871053 RepID=UPI0025D52853|nr:SDR family NAD(P)-dependent oxidoreductase [Phenylobacterium sp.]MCG9916705.1 SDR family NAD(P)-dependent oxidoreductase [Phenylobacterium sp.]
MGASVIIGAAGGIGAALVARLAAQPNAGPVLALSRSRPETLPSGVMWRPIDLEDESSILRAADSLDPEVPLDRVLVTTGRLHIAGRPPEKSWRHLEAEALMAAFAANAVGPAMAAKHFLPRLPRDRPCVFAALSARVGSIGDNHLGGWYGYRASKAALNQLIHTLAIELARQRPQAICVALHPGTVDTGLSAPFQAGVSGEALFTPEFAAERLLEVLAGLTAGDSGGFFAWDGQPVPW